MKVEKWLPGYSGRNCKCRGISVQQEVILGTADACQETSSTQGMPSCGSTGGILSLCTSSHVVIISQMVVLDDKRGKDAFATTRFASVDRPI